MKTKDTTLISCYIALLLGGQFALSSFYGIEVVTVLLLSFCFVFGAVRGIIVASAFSVLRCVIFGFYPSVFILYIIYYNFFALFFGIFGKRKKGVYNKKSTLIFTVFFALLFTACFTLLDDVITPLYYGFDYESAKAYFIYSLTAMIPQLICSFVTVVLLFIPIVKVLINFDTRRE